MYIMNVQWIYFLPVHLNILYMCMHVRHPNSLSLGFNILDAIVAIYLSQLLF